MEEYEVIIGIFPYDFVSDKGERIKGVSVFIGEKDAQKGVGYRCDKKSLTEEEFANVFTDMNTAAKLLMKPVEISYTRRGKPAYVEVVTQPQK